MQRSQRTFKLVMAGLLCAIGILAPVISPVKIDLEPASFTLASHVALFIAMFLSPKIAAAVWLGTTLGFQLAGFPPVVVARAASGAIPTPCAARCRTRCSALSPAWSTACARCWW